MSITIRLHRIEVPLVRPFRTSFGTETMRDLILVEAVSATAAPEPDPK